MNRFFSGFGSLLAAALCLFLAVSPKVNPLTTQAQAFQRDIAVASGATYISLRAINAALSFAQEVEVGATLGVSANVQPLKWLEPVDDTVERVSGLVFAVAVLTGVLSMSMGPVAAVGFLLLALGLLGRSTCEATGGWHRAPGPFRRACGGCGGLGFAMAIGVPLAFVLGIWGGEVLTAEAWAQSHAVLERIGGEAEQLIGTADLAEERSWREAITAYTNAAQSFWDNADDLLDASLTITGIFLLRMIVLPSLALLAVLRLVKHLFGGAA
ncbi:hypothetical protein ACX9MO_11620 [Pseudooceanicola sp. 502str34]